MSKRKAGGPPAAPKPRDRYELGTWAEGEGTDLTNSAEWQSEMGCRLGEDISAGKHYDPKTGQKINDVAVPNAEEPNYHIDFKVQESDPNPKTILNPTNALAKIQLIRTLQEKLGRLVPVLILNPMGLRPAVRHDNPAVKGLWVRYRVAFLQDDGLSEVVSWNEVVLEGVMSLQQLFTDESESLEHLTTLLETEVAKIDRAVFARRIDELEVQLLLKVGKTFSPSSPQAKRIAFGTLVNDAGPEVRDHVVLTAIADADSTDQTRLLQNAITEVEPEVRKQVIQNAITEAEPEVRQSVLATLSIADLEAALARHKAASGADTSKK